MAYKQYPVKLYYFYEGTKAKYFDDRWKADSESWSYAQASKQDVTVWVVEFPRSLNSKVALDILMGRFDPYNRRKFYTQRYYAPNQQQQQKAEPPKSEKVEGIPTDPFVLLGLGGRWESKENVRAAWIKKLKEHHPDAGGKTEWSQAVNAAKDKIYRMNGWS